ncbi:MAG: DUF1801 domain-containing protein [Pseudomonadota bacterium]
MAKANNKTVPTKASVSAFLSSVEDANKRRDVKKIMAIMRRITGKRATMWGPSLIGFGQYDYKYASGREGSFCITGVSPRAQNVSIYIMDGFTKYAALLKRLGKHKTGRACLYIKRLDDVDEGVLETLIERSVRTMQKTHTTR